MLSWELTTELESCNMMMSVHDVYPLQQQRWGEKKCRPHWDLWSWPLQYEIWNLMMVCSLLLHFFFGSEQCCDSGGDDGGSGISLKTQELYAIVFATRYLDLFTVFHSVYNTVMKLIFLGSSFSIVWYMRYHKVVRKTYDKEHDTFRHYLLIVPCFLLALFINYKFTFMEVSWLFLLCHWNRASSFLHWSCRHSVHIQVERILCLVLWIREEPFAFACFVFVETYLIDQQCCFQVKSLVHVWLIFISTSTHSSAAV